MGPRLATGRVHSPAHGGRVRRRPSPVRSIPSSSGYFPDRRENSSLSRYDSRVSDFRTHLKALRDGLLRLHKSLLELDRAAYERDVAPITTTGQYLNLVLDDPAFLWLRELSAFIVMIDEALAQKAPRSEEHTSELQTLRHLLC